MWKEKPLKRALPLVRLHSAQHSWRLQKYIFWGKKSFFSDLFFSFDPLDRIYHHSRRTAATLPLLPLVFISLLSLSGDAGTIQSAVNPGRRMYTVLPPPADYKTNSEKSVTLPQLENINSDKDPAGKKIIIVHLCTCVLMCTIKLCEIYSMGFLQVSNIMKVTSENQSCVWTEENLNAAQMFAWAWAIFTLIRLLTLLFVRVNFYNFSYLTSSFELMLLPRWNDLDPRWLSALSVAINRWNDQNVIRVLAHYTCLHTHHFTERRSLSTWRASALPHWNRGDLLAETVRCLNVPTWNNDEVNSSLINCTRRPNSALIESHFWFSELRALLFKVGLGWVSQRFCDDKSINVIL